MWPTLNWKEAAALVEAIGPEIEGLFVDRVIIPERPRFPAGFLRNEWTMRLTGRRSEAALYFGMRPRQPYLAFSGGKGPKAATGATHSPFTLGLSKTLKGARVLGLEALPRERIVVLWMTSEGASSGRERMGLVLCLIPAMPEALLVRQAASEPEAWRILSRSRAPGVEQDGTELFEAPSGSNAPVDPPIRAELVREPRSYFEAIEKALAAEAFGLRLRAAERELREKVKGARERVRQSGTALREADREPDWRRYGELFKNSMHRIAPIEQSPTGPVWRVTDFETGEDLLIPADPKLSAQQQVEKFFQLARRKARRAEEARGRIATFQENATRWEASLANPPPEGDWAALERFERQAGILPQNRAQASAKASGGGGKGKAASWLGKSFVSKDGLLILAGRSKDENLELTFKHARGNDVWLHVRGRPGAHVIVPLQPGKSAPLETLLDAATLAIYYSGGEKWGKTEVDYTYKKYVRRIKDSTEASYTNNKTLLLEPEPARIKRLLASHEA